QPWRTSVCLRCLRDHGRCRRNSSSPTSTSSTSVRSFRDGFLPRSSGGMTTEPSIWTASPRFHGSGCARPGGARLAVLRAPVLAHR
ncbi:GBP2, partial [Symbiodinium sp. KB8]